MVQATEACGTALLRALRLGQRALPPCKSPPSSGRHPDPDRFFRSSSASREHSKKELRSCLRGGRPAGVANWWPQLSAPYEIMYPENGLIRRCRGPSIELSCVCNMIFLKMLEDNRLRCEERSTSSSP